MSVPFRFFLYFFIIYLYRMVFHSKKTFMWFWTLLQVIFVLSVQYIIRTVLYDILLNICKSRMSPLRIDIISPDFFGINIFYEPSYSFRLLELLCNKNLLSFYNQQKRYLNDFLFLGFWFFLFFNNLVILKIICLKYKATIDKK